MNRSSRGGKKCKALWAGPDWILRYIKTTFTFFYHLKYWLDDNVIASYHILCVGQWRGTEKFRCYPSLQEIGHVAVCDGVIDCKNGFDEANETCGEWIMSDTEGCTTSVRLPYIHEYILDNRTDVGPTYAHTSRTYTHARTHHTHTHARAHARARTDTP